MLPAGATCPNLRAHLIPLKPTARSSAALPPRGATTPVVLSLRQSLYSAASTLHNLISPCTMPFAAVVPSPGQSVYSAAKAGLRAYFQSMATELSERGLGATVCCPGPLATGGDGKPRMVYGPDGLISQVGWVDRWVGR